MQHITVKVKNLNQKYFSQYGKVLGPQDGVPSSSNELFDIWVRFDEIISRVGVSKLSWFNVKPKRDFIRNKIERHLESSETIIPMHGQSIMIVGLSKNSNPEEQLDLGTINAFYLDGTRGINLKPGVWHWIPDPLSDEANFILVSGDEINKKDCEITDLKEKMNLELNIVL